MRRIYESRALVRDDEDPHAPAERDDDEASPRASRTLNWERFSHAFLPKGLRDRAVAVSLETDREAYAPGESIRFRVTLRNRLPFPVSVRTLTPVRWIWAVDGVARATHVPEFDPPDRPGLLTFGRSETKTFTRTWAGKIRTDADTWEAIDPGEHTISAWVNVDDAEGRRLRADRTVEIR